MSPAKNIPRGTLCGCLTTFTVFLVLSVLTSLTCDPALLQHDCMYMVQVRPSPLTAPDPLAPPPLPQFTFLKPLVLVGVVLATWSASLSNMIGASRVLQVSRLDINMVLVLYKGTVRNNPISAVITTFGFIQLCFLIGRHVGGV